MKEHPNMSSSECPTNFFFSLLHIFIIIIIIVFQVETHLFVFSHPQRIAVNIRLSKEDYDDDELEEEEEVEDEEITWNNILINIEANDTHMITTLWQLIWYSNIYPKSQHLFFISLLFHSNTGNICMNLDWFLGNHNHWTILFYYLWTHSLMFNIIIITLMINLNWHAILLLK